MVRRPETTLKRLNIREKKEDKPSLREKSSKTKLQEQQ